MFCLNIHAGGCSSTEQTERVHEGNLQPVYISCGVNSTENESYPLTDTHTLCMKLFIAKVAPSSVLVLISFYFFSSFHLAYALVSTWLPSGIAGMRMLQRLQETLLIHFLSCNDFLFIFGHTAEELLSI